MALPLSQLPQEMLREVRQRKWLAFLLFVLVAAVVLAAGFFWRYKYQSQVVIYVDDSNIIKPLMEGSAVTTKISDRASSAEQLLGSRDVLSKIAKDVQIFGPNADQLGQRDLEQRMDALRNGLNVQALGKNYFAIQYTGHDQRRVFLVAQRLGQLFISDSEQHKKDESRGAYNFINKQVKAYEQQLQQAQENLKDFKTKNTDGTAQEASNKIADLRGKIELAHMDLQEAQAKKSSIEKQLNGVGQTVTQGQTEDIYQNRINSLQQKLDSLRLQYKDSYPDIVNLKQQIKQLEKMHRQALQNNSADQVTQGQQVINPLYQDLRSQLANVTANIQSIQTRLKALNGLLGQEKQRMKRIQASQAQYAELTRGMEVNKEIYNDLLKRREKARVSMRLDLDGQGLNYRIRESAQYPLIPVGTKFSMFAAAGLFLGLLAPFGLAAGFAQVDPRIRHRGAIEEELAVPVLTVLPQVRTPFEQRQDRRRTWVIGTLALLAAIAYGAVAGLHLLGVV